LGREQPLRMAVAASGAPGPIIDWAPRASALPAYSAPAAFDWRSDEPLAAAAPAKP
jgi:hypothetical protein